MQALGRHLDPGRDGGQEVNHKGTLPDVMPCHCKAIHDKSGGRMLHSDQAGVEAQQDVQSENQS